MILPIKHKRGTTIPTANDLVVGEIAINTATGLCYTKTGAGNVVAIGLDVAANWGNIGGTLSSQTDLQSALDAKYDASNPDGFIPEAPIDNYQYSRQNGQWQVIDLDGNNIPDYDNFVTYAAGSQVYFQGKLYRMVNTAGAAGYDPIGHPSYWESLSGTSPDLSGYALLSGATFTGKVVTTATATTAPLNIAVATTNPTTTVAGDIWVGTNNVFFKDSTNVQRALVNQNTQNTFTSNQIVSATTTSALLRLTQTGTGHSLVVEDNTNPDTTAFIINNVGAVGIQKDPATWTHISGTALDVTGRAMFIPINANSPSLNVGSTACNSAPTNASAGDVWITNAASPKLAFQTGGGNYYCVVANQFNTFTGQVAISGSSATNPQLQITQTGAGNALVVEDSASPDTNSFVVNGAGSVGIGVSPVSGAWTPTRKLEVVGSISCTTESATTDSIDVATTAHVKSVMRGQVISDASETYSLPFSGIVPNVIIKKANDGTGNTTYIEVPYNVIPVGTQFVLIQVGSYPFVVQPASGVTLYSNGGKYRSNGEHSICTLIKTDTNEWYLAGDLTT